MTTSTITRPAHVTLRTVSSAFHARRPFTCNSTLTGTVGSAGTFGRLDGEDRARFLADRRAGRIVFTVRSYATPVAWVLDDGTVVRPVTRYSVTTSRHVTALRLTGGAR